MPEPTTEAPAAEPRHSADTVAYLQSIVGNLHLLHEFALAQGWDEQRTAEWMGNAGNVTYLLDTGGDGIVPGTEPPPEGQLTGERRVQHGTHRREERHHMSNIKVRVGQRELDWDEARRNMDPALVARFQAQHPHVDNEQGAQAFVDAYMQHHQQTHGRPWDGQPMPPAHAQGTPGHQGDPGHQGGGPQGGAQPRR